MNNGAFSGIVNINKPSGWTSFDVVARLRGVLGIKKIGHTGTLDPDATGVLVICVGKATTLVESLSKHDKTYEAVMLLGTVTDTQDISGTVLTMSEDIPDEQTIIEGFVPFSGQILQTPPMYSAKKKNGKKLYELAREGIEIPRDPVEVTIYSIEITKIDLPRVYFTVTCSSGTYIRTLCHDIGAALGCGACMESLHRTRVGDYAIDKSFTISQVEELVSKSDKSFITGIEAFFDDLPMITPKPGAARLVENGTLIPVDLLNNPPEGRYRLYHPDGRFAGIYNIDRRFARVEKNFLERK